MTTAQVITIILVINIIGAILVFMFYRWSKIKTGCDHAFPKNNELNPKCDKCGERLIELIDKEFKK